MKNTSVFTQRGRFSPSKETHSNVKMVWMAEDGQQAWLQSLSPCLLRLSRELAGQRRLELFPSWLSCDSLSFTLSFTLILAKGTKLHVNCFFLKLSKKKETLSPDYGEGGGSDSALKKMLPPWTCPSRVEAVCWGDPGLHCFLRFPAQTQGSF